MTRCRKSVPGRGNSPCKGLVTGVPGVSQGGQCAQESPSAKQGGPGADGTGRGPTSPDGLPLPLNHRLVAMKNKKWFFLSFLKKIFVRLVTPGLVATCGI